MTYNKVFVVDD
ncbi:Protein of unknown function [Lactobacillus delbrueckii subsp. bulgaricus]|nr:Protein of unknown function [Lactobacillus delbrueckii subsp. bulgaricus]